LTSDFTPPADADPGLVRFYSALDVFEDDMQAHIELEDNVLFPRALELEAQSHPALVVSREGAL
jgi:regulator of cell morphogenesis and NO signaling